MQKLKQLLENVCQWSANRDIHRTSYHYIHLTSSTNLASILYVKKHYTYIIISVHIHIIERNNMCFCKYLIPCIWTCAYVKKGPIQGGSTDIVSSPTPPSWYIVPRLLPLLKQSSPQLHKTLTDTKLSCYMVCPVFLGTTPFLHFCTIIDKYFLITKAEYHWIKPVIQILAWLNWVGS